MDKRMKYILIGLVVLFVCVFIYKGIDHLVLTYKIKKSLEQPAVVSAMQAKDMEWQQRYIAPANIVAVKGVNVTTQIAGQVEKIYFVAGTFTEENTPLIQLNAKDDIALLHSLEANMELAKINYKRDKAQYESVHAVAKSVVDTDLQNLKSTTALVKQQAEIVAKKTIHAPFSGFLGIRLVNVGQFLNPGDALVTLQTFDPIYADFYLPQQTLANLHLGDNVFIKSDVYPKNIFIGKITTINPLVDSATRNVLVEALVSNSEKLLYPGMYASSEVHFGKPVSYITLPLTVVSFNTYGEIVYRIKKSKDKEGNHILIAKETFIKTGEVRGDQVAVLEGLKEGDLVVTGGQLKLKNNSRVVIDNSRVPPAKQNPYVTNDL